MHQVMRSIVYHAGTWPGINSHGGGTSKRLDGAGSLRYSFGRILRGAFLINPRWMANAYLEYFEIDNSDVDATYIDTTISLEYRIGERTGVGVAYNLVNVDGEDKGSDDAVAFDYDGFLLYLFYNFR